MAGNCFTCIFDGAAVFDLTVVATASATRGKGATRALQFFHEHVHKTTASSIFCMRVQVYNNSLLDAMDRFVEQYTPSSHGSEKPLVVMGSMQLTSGVLK